MSPSEAPSARIGLEVHVYLRTRAKLFCACPADFLDAAPNTRVCPRCFGVPGAKPMAPNRAAFEAALRIARALGATESARARFVRKHYFYPDSPANYQRTSEPVGTGGALLGVRLREMHVEEDPGAYDPATGLVDYNRAGAPLVEIVTEPDLRAPADARRFLQELRLVLGYLGVWREDAGLKADCNVSLPGGERVEVKNVNSLRNVERALEHEIRRQRDAMTRGEPIARETRHFDEATGETRGMRLKESEADYRLLADPDVAPVDLGALARQLPAEEGPLARRARLALLAGVPEDAASPLLDERALADAFEAAAARAPPRLAFDFIVRDVRGELGARGASLHASGLTGGDVARLVDALARGILTPMVATRILRDALDGKGVVEAALAAEAAQGKPADEALAQAAEDALRANPKAVADYRAGKQGALHFLVGQAMRALKGRGEAERVRAAVAEALARLP